MSSKQQNEKKLPLKPLSVTPLISNKSIGQHIVYAKRKPFFGAKKIQRIISKLLFHRARNRPQLKKNNKKKLLEKYMWFFTHKTLFSWRESNSESRVSLKYLKISARKVLRKYLKEYIADYLRTFHNDDRQRVQIRILRQTHKAKLEKLFFQPWKKIFVPPTGRQHWLNTTYSRYQNLRFKDRIDFFRTYLGQIIGNMYWKFGGNFYKDIPVPLTATYFKYQISHKMGWWYENLAQKRRTPRSAKRFVLDRPKTAFQIHWEQRKLEPWKDALLFKRALYSGFGEDYRKENQFQVLKIKNYLRSKNPRQEKRNRLYTRANFLLNNFRQRSRIRADKLARIKQVASKILRPFYGHLRPRQIKQIVRKSKKTKSSVLSCNEVILSHFENRLDVVIYRLNLAPSILWARRLIKAGLVFVTPEYSSLLWESMYRGLKRVSFPLKLRDPKNLYTKTYWTYFQQNWVEFKFLGQPKKKISYLLQPGDLIQCAAGASLNHFKTRSWLCRKPVPAHLMVRKQKNFVWDWHAQNFTQQAFKSWEKNSESVHAAIFLHSPQYRDLDLKDRVKEAFLRWAVL